MQEILGWPNHQHLPQDQIASEDVVVRLGSEGCHLLRAVKTCETVAHRYYQQLIKLHRAWKKAAEKTFIGKDMTSWFSSTTTHINNGPKLLGHSTGKCPIPLTHQTWHLLTITCFRRWATRSLSGTSILTKTSENGLISGLLRKMRNFFGMVYTYCPKDRKNV